MITTRAAHPVSYTNRKGQHFARRQRRERPASQVMRFAEPLLAAAGNEYDRTQHALTLAMAFWNLALVDGDEHDEMLAGLVDTIADDEARDSAPRDRRRHGRSPSRDVPGAASRASMTRDERSSDHARNTVRELLTAGERLPDSRPYPRLNEDRRTVGIGG